MILLRDAHRLVVDKAAGQADTAGGGVLGAVEWLALHLDVSVAPAMRLEQGASGVLLCSDGRSVDLEGTVIYDLVSHVDVRALGRDDVWTTADPFDESHPPVRYERVEARCGVVFYRAEAVLGDAARIRVQAAAAGIPILGDVAGGGRPWPRLGLHAAELRLPDRDRPVIAFRPPSFTALLEGRDTGFDLCRDRRGGWLTPITDAFRAVHRDEIPGLPAAVDVYGDWFDGVWFDESVDLEAARSALEPILDRVADVHDCRGGTMRIHRRNPHRRTLVTETTIVGEAPPPRFTVQEHGLLYEISLTETQHTGLFLDQRDTRRRLALRSANARLANLFAYTCSFSVAAAAAGAEVVFSVDVAKPCLTTGKTNFELNGLTETKRGKFVQEDARTWLQRQQRRRRENPGEYRPFDLVVCDPPVFASSRDGGAFSVEKEWGTLAEAAAELLSDRGAAVFANNHRGGDHRQYLQTVVDAFGHALELAPPLDFPAGPGVPHHVRTFLCRKKGSQHSRPDQPEI